MSPRFALRVLFDYVQDYHNQHHTRWVVEDVPSVFECARYGCKDAAAAFRELEEALGAAGR